MHAIQIKLSSFFFFFFVIDENTILFSRKEGRKWEFIFLFTEILNGYSFPVTIFNYLFAYLTPKD